MAGLPKAEALIKKYEAVSSVFPLYGGKKKSGTGHTPKEILADTKLWKEYQQARGKEAYLQMVEQLLDEKYHKQHPKEYVDLCKYIYETAFGKPAQTVIADLGDMPMNINFLMAPKPKELSDGKTTNGTEITKGNTGTAEATR